MKLTNATIISGMLLPMAMWSAAQAPQTPQYMRSSIYMILVQSENQNQRLEKEAKSIDENEWLAVGKAFANTDAKKAKAEEASEFANVPLTKLPQVRFLDIPIPNQFNDHNLSERILDFDAVKSGMSKDEKDALTPKGAKKKGNGFKAFAGGLMGAAAGKSESSMVRAEEVDEWMAPVVQKYFRQNNVAEHIVGKWFGYEADSANHWDPDFKLILDRGLQNASAEELNMAAKNTNLNSMLAGKGFDLINNTYVVALNLRFRNNKAVAAEAEAMAKGMFGSLGSVAGAIGRAAVGEGFTVQAVSQLYKLDWNDEISTAVAENIVDKNATIDDLVKLGICKLTYVGSEKSSASVRQSYFSNKPVSELVLRATGRSIDGAIAKLQEKNEVFRTIVPISEVGADGAIYAKIGMKEGLSKGDEYQILEPQEDANGRLTYKEVGKVKVDEKHIWNNLYGAEEEAAENLAANKVADEDAAIEFGATRFLGAKKGTDYSGYLLRLKKKK